MGVGRTIDNRQKAIDNHSTINYTTWGLYLMATSDTQALTAATTVYSDSRQARALDIARRRRVHPQALPNGRWRAHTDKGTSVGTDDYADPVEALEAAEVSLAAGDGRTVELQARELIDAVGAGVYAPWPKTVQSGDDKGGLAWVVLRTSDRKQVGQPYPGLLSALIEIQRLNKVGAVGMTTTG